MAKRNITLALASASHSLFSKFLQLRTVILNSFYFGHVLKARLCPVPSLYNVFKFWVVLALSVCPMKIKCQQFNYVEIVWVVRQIFCTPSVPSDTNCTGLNSVCYACVMMHETQYCMVRIFPYRNTAPFTSTCTLKTGVA